MSTQTRTRPSVRRAARPITATVVDEDLVPTIVVTSAGTASMAEIKAAARKAWTIPGPLQILESGMVRRKELVGGRKVRTTHYRTVFAPEPSAWR